MNSRIGVNFEISIGSRISIGARKSQVNDELFKLALLGVALPYMISSVGAIGGLL